MATESTTLLDLYRANLGLAGRVRSFGQRTNSAAPPATARRCAQQGEQHVS
jgi:hypothetical protein